MADQQRGRSPSAGHQNHIRHTPSPSPHNAFRQPQGLGLDQTLGGSTTTTTFATSFDPNFATLESNDFLTTSQPQQDTFAAQADAAQNNFLSAQTASQPGRQSPSLNAPSGNDFSSDFIDPSSGANNNFNDQFFGNSGSLDQDFLDPQLLGGDQQNDASVDPTNLMNNMATHQHTPTPPHMLQGGIDRRSVSPHVSPNPSQGPFQPPNHSRHTSLDPSSAAFPQGLNAGWGEGNQFYNHRRTPSDAHSDISSNHNSPFLATADSFEAPIDHHSPLLGAQQDPVMFQNMGFENINISDAQIQQQQQRISPSPSPHISPRIAPQQQQLPPFTSADNFGLSAPPMQNQYLGQSGGDVYQANQETFPTFGHNGSVDMGQSGALSPPEINIQPAPPSRQTSFEPNKEGSQDALSPPERSRNKNRMRAISDPYTGSRPQSPANGHQRNTLSPHAARVSRSPSPSRAGNRRSSTSSVPNRDYILDLADPSRPQSNSPGDSSSPGRQRTQKHPATFQCSLCPKRFTRAYNLRSHLRTHTDERPFVCSVCGKAFARQHDRKRHEGLHSGEKRFVCRGRLKTNDSWGCGRKFARADALGRHFRSEAGRVCIKPLLEEEAAEKGGWEGQGADSVQQPNMLGVNMPQAAGMMPIGQPVAMPFQLPQVLYQQFPMLQGMNWDAMPAGNDDVDDISGRSSFDASSGGEMEDYEDGGYPIAQGWASDTGGY